MDLNETMKTKIAALILAGGKSSRMGRDKALIPWQGIPMLARVSDVAENCCDRVYIFTPRIFQYQTILKKDYFFLKEYNPGKGPLIAFAEALSQINCQENFEWVLLLACDLPKLRSKIVQNWSKKLNPIPDNIMALVPQNNSKYEPLCAFYRPQVLPELEHFINRGGNSFQIWLSSISVRSISISSEDSLMLFNCNTPFDLE